jgi:hypothetical protein
MKKLILLAALLWPVWKPAKALAEGSVAFAQNKRVVVSTSTTGTLILAADNYAKRTCLMNSTTNYLMLSDASDGFSISATTGSARVPGTVASTNPAWYCLDGPSAPYKGPLYGVSGAAGDITIDVHRVK